MNIVINDATSGIGKALAERLSQENCKLSICGQSSDKFVDGSHSVMGKMHILADREH